MMGKVFQNKFSPESKLWVFQSDKELDGESVLGELSSFFANWQTHGRTVESACSVIEGRFLLVVVNEANYTVSGCAIDELTKTIRKVGEGRNLNLLDRGGFYYVVSEGLSYVKFTDFKKLYQQGVLKDDTDFYDASISINRELSTRWVSKIKDSWIKNRFL